MLCSGTLRPDLIESASVLASNKAQVIKTHHNDTQLVRELRNLVSECVLEVCAASCNCIMTVLHYLIMRLLISNLWVS